MIKSPIDEKIIQGKMHMLDDDNQDLNYYFLQHYKKKILDVVHCLSNDKRRY